jgi:hypothetical protein
MQRLAEPVDAALGLLGALDEAGALLGALEADVVGEDALALLVELLEVFGLLLHAVIARATMPMAAMPCTVFFTTPPVSFRRLDLSLDSLRLADLWRR